MIIHRGIDQGTPEWFALRLGIPTASRFKDVMAKGEGKTRTSYLYQLAAEVLTGQSEEKFSNDYMEWGTLNEPHARAAYEFILGESVEQVAIITSESPMAGYSPDGLIGNNGALEIKCPKTTTHIETVIAGKMPKIHEPQVQGGLLVSEREWIDFVSYDPRIKSESSFFSVRIYRDDAYIKTLSEELDRFSDDLENLVAKFKSRSEV